MAAGRSARPEPPTPAKEALHGLAEMHVRVCNLGSIIRPHQHSARNKAPDARQGSTIKPTPASAFQLVPLAAPSIALRMQRICFCRARRRSPPFVRMALGKERFVRSSRFAAVWAPAPPCHSVLHFATALAFSSIGCWPLIMRPANTERHSFLGAYAALRVSLAADFYSSPLFSTASTALWSSLCSWRFQAARPC